jgi:ATP/maltotriose-dependent transcriptional regulator MalT
VTRIAIVAESEELRAALASVLSASAAFEIVSVGASAADVSQAADVVVNASEATVSTRVASSHVESGEPALTNRERQVLGLLADGLGNKQNAARLGISTNTVKTHLELLFDKLGVSSRTEAVATAARRGLLLL